MRPWILSELNYGHVKSHPKIEVAVLPLGATNHCIFCDANAPSRST